MKRGDVIVLFFAGLLILSMAFIGTITGYAVHEGSESRGVFEQVVRGSKEEPKIQCQLEPLKNKNVKIKGVKGYVIIDCNNVVGLCSDSIVASKYAEIIIGQGGGRCIYSLEKGVAGEPVSYASGTRIAYDSVNRKIRVIADSADKIVKPVKIANYIPFARTKKCDEKIDLKVNPIKTKLHGSILNIQATFKCKNDKVPPNVIIKHNKRIVARLSLVPQRNRGNVYSNVYLTENSGKHEIIVQYGNLREKVKVKI